MHPKARPQRPTLCDEQGRRASLGQGPESFVCLTARPDAPFASGAGTGRGHVVLGLGALGAPGAFCPDVLPHAALAGTDADVLWLECPEVLHAMAAAAETDGEWLSRLPAHWRPLLQYKNSSLRAAHTFSEILPALGKAPEQALEKALDRAMAEGRHIWWHRQNMRLFPSYWAPLLGAVQARILRPAGSVPVASTVLLPGHEGQLLHRELAQAFAQAGFAVPVLGGGNGETDEKALRQVLHAQRPALFFSVNLRGLDADGARFALLRALGVPVALWFVDNPWHVLSALRSAWWKKAHLFVTDASFIPALRGAGAKSVTHLPLAASQGMWGARAAWPVGTDEAARQSGCVFVGRASFPDRDKFFAAARVDAADASEALALLPGEGKGAGDTAARPDFHWWTRRQQCTLWPGHAVRCAGLGAELCAAQRRALWIEAGLGQGMAVFGDVEGWRALLPATPGGIFHPAVDYYAGLPGLYAAAFSVLNVTSLLLPAGLTQRHFDVWAAGGFLFSDTTPGLDIFPAQLVGPVALAKAADLPKALLPLRQSPSLREDVMAAWQEHIREFHQYSHRVARVLEVLEERG